MIIHHDELKTLDNDEALEIIDIIKALYAVILYSIVISLVKLK